MFRFARSGVTTLAAAATSYSLYSHRLRASCDYDRKGTPDTISYNGTFLELAGVGMRRKNLYVTMVDVYVVGMYLSPKTVVDLKRVKSGNFSDIILKSCDKDEVRAGATLKFVRDVGQSSIVQAFDEAFTGCDKEEIRVFKDALSQEVGEGGLKKGETLAFYWLGKNGLEIKKNDSAGKIFIQQEIGKRLLGVYLDPEKTVSRELVETVASTLA